MKGYPHTGMSQLAKLPEWLKRSMELNDLSDLQLKSQGLHSRRENLQSIDISEPLLTTLKYKGGNDES